MEDSSEESVVHIDVCDVGNQLVVVEYVKDLYGYYRSMELKFIAIMKKLGGFSPFDFYTKRSNALIFLLLKNASYSLIKLND
ncbi:hypothetical protein HanIR_Chr07g0317161 [Helianthus annuus]|nr:hypothetical protein HanIR_Chr07g0317161 [Helianthus annuus]